MSSAQPAPDGRVGQVIGGRWTLERVLGEGAMAVVYAARDAAGAQAAVKLLRPELTSSADVRRRFVHEGGAASRIAHPGVVRVLEHAGNDPETAYLVMELLEGETLAERLTRKPELAMSELLDVFDQLLDVLAEAHAERVAHRDLKPSNVFLTRDARVKLLDFGVARMIDPIVGAGETRIGLAIGTVPYMAPEQALGRHHEIDGKTDLFSVGAIMFRILARRRIHEGANDAELLGKMATLPAPPLASIAPHVPPELCAIVDLALGFSRDARYPDARTMQADVRAVSSGHEPPFAMRARAAREKATVFPARAAPEPPGNAPESSPAEALVGQVLADRYRIEALIGMGGMGAVYRAQHVHMRKAVAVKVLHREMTAHAEVVARFEREAVAAARIDHPNVAAARDFGKLDDGSFYLVLEFVEGRSLRELIREYRKTRHGVPAARALPVTRQIAAALAAAHAAGIVHRDLKPENVMLVDVGGREGVKVLDFGIAKLSAEDARDAPVLTRMGAVFGTPEYMSPEQALGQTVDTRSDLYALGIMLYEMLASVTPFAADEMVVVLTRQMTEQPPPLPQGIEPEVVKLVMALLEKDPARRVQTAAELVERIDALLGAPVSATASARSRTPLSREELETGATVLGMESPTGAGAVTAATPGHLARAGARLWQHRVQIAGRSVPLWAIALIALVPVIAATLLIDSSPEPRGQSAATATPLSERLGFGENRELVALRTRALEGDRAALAKLQARPSDDRKAADWQALAHGYAVAGELADSVKAYHHLLEQEPDFGEKRETLTDLRRAALSTETSEAALQVIAKLEASGADLLFGVYEDLARASPTQAARAKQLLSTEEVQARASPALLVLIELRETKGCRAYKELLPRVAEHADQRAVPVLERLTKRRGCGFFRRGDCYSCLRSDDTLKEALAAAQQRAAPKFTQ